MYSILRRVHFFKLCFSYRLSQSFNSCDFCFIHTPTKCPHELQIYHLWASQGYRESYDLHVWAIRNARRVLYQLRALIIRDPKASPWNCNAQDGRSFDSYQQLVTRYSWIRLLNVGILDQPHRPHRQLLPERNFGEWFPATKERLNCATNLIQEFRKRYFHWVQGQCILTDGS
jgi:hypothetical protein